MSSGFLPSPPMLPTAEERAALQIVARYLARVGTTTGTLLLGLDASSELALAHAIRDQFATSAALCRDVLEACQEDHAWLIRLP